MHVLSGPDHLAAVLPFATTNGQKQALRVGVRWGLGHVGGVLVVGLLAIGLREALPLEAISVWSERLVGLSLVAIGAWAIRRAVGVRIHVHEHLHDGRRHAHIHAHGAQDGDHAGPHRHAHAAFGVGVLHGLAGSAHLLGVLPALALPAPEAALYLGAFGVGTVGAMVAFSSSVGWATLRMTRGHDRWHRIGTWHRALLGASGAVTFSVGVVWLMLPLV